MKTIIVEDEPHNSRMLQGLVESLRPEWEILGVFESIKSTVMWLMNNPDPELIFMDIQLTDGVCFSIFDQVELSSMVIFTTAYDEFAIQAFNVNSIDYLLKPLKKSKLEKALVKFEAFAKDWRSPDDGSEKLDYNELLQAIKQGEKKYRKRFLVAGPTDYYKLNIEDIAYFTTESRVCLAVGFDGKQHVLDQTMEKLEEQLDPQCFFRANRSVIVHIDAIRKFESYFGGKLSVRLVTPFTEPITVSRLKATAFRDWLDG